MDFANVGIPEEVIEFHVLPKLDWNDLLRLRRVSKISKGITDRYLRVNPQLAPEVEINDGSHSFGHFLRTGIPSTRIFINNSSGYGFFDRDDENQTEFLRENGPLVKHLRISQLSAFVFGKERDFLEALTNLETLEAGCIGIGLNLNWYVGFPEMQVARMSQLANRDPRFLENRHPDVFRGLKILKIGHDECLKYKMYVGNVVHYSNSLLKHCKNVTSAFLPLSSSMISDVTTGFEGNGLPRADDVPQPHVLTVAIQLVHEYIDKMRKESGGLDNNLKIYDFGNYHDEDDFDGECSSNFLRLCALCNDPEIEVRLMNVEAFWFLDVAITDQYDLTDIGTQVVSLVNMHPSALFVSLPNLEKVDVRRTALSFVGPHWKMWRQEWPALKILHFTVDSKAAKIGEDDGTPGGDRRFRKEDTAVLFQFFFHEIVRPTLTELSISFVKGAGPKTVPNTEEIVASCPNLKKLMLGKWLGTNEALTTLWSGLPDLEEISLEKCKDLDDRVAFVGEDEKNPVFLKLKKLRKLSLRGLDDMPQITDTLFSVVLCHMKLTHLILTSRTPVHSVTSAGVLKLLEGGFAESIQKFPFSGCWSLADVSRDEFKKMGKKFRSYDML